MHPVLPLARLVSGAVTFLFSTIMVAQTYWGSNQLGGVYGNGSLFTVTESGTFTKKHDFFRYFGGDPKSDLLKASNGIYYGVTEADGTNGAGVLFSYDPTTQTYTVRFNFVPGTAEAGTAPIRGLVQAGNGLLYGLCRAGGANGLGTIFSYNPTTHAVVRLHSFSGANGSTPFSKLILGASNLTLWGTTQFGGASSNNGGVVFEYTIGASTPFQRRASFDAAAGNVTGRLPRTGLTRTTNGRMFGVTSGGGANGFGTVFEINTSTYAITVVRALTAADGSVPFGGLVESSTNVLHGTTTAQGANGSGTVFTVNATVTPATFTKVHDLTGTVASNIYSTMTKGTDGLLYGTSHFGGASSQGVIFSYNTSTNVLSPLASFQSVGLSESYGGVIQDGAVWYGLCSSGGPGTGGGLYRFTPATSTITSLLYFNASNGHNPQGRMLMGSNGRLYGTTLNGGVLGQGVIYSINPTNSAYTRMFDLGGTNGTFPQGYLVEVSGKLYGLCTDGGANAAGTIFEYDLNTNVFTKKKDLETANGSRPLAGFLVASNGSLYTTTSQGGANGLGTILRYVPSTNTLTKVHDFSSTTGGAPMSSLFQAGNGLLYGTTVRGGVVDAGTLYSFNTVSNTFTKLYDFDGLQGGAPAGDLIQATNGKLYGTCRDDGLYFNGCIFSWNITTGTYTEEYDMQLAEGALSEAKLVQGNDGRLYGTCVQGGTANEGTVFRFDPTTLAFTVLQNLAEATTGKWPADGLTREVAAVPSTDLLLDAKLFLEGPYVAAETRMTDGLRTLTGANGFPLTEPFTALGFTQAGGGGGETIAASVLTATGDNAIVDWVLVELRDKNNSSSIVRTRAALLQRDGNVVGLNGTSVVGINAPAGEYFVALRSRNHFGVMRSTVVTLNSSTATTLNFT
ncbi:MAG TPA: choice-of-anchor tandem repeat GloVer-containing protein, partial [Flavobacteriales bacterium]